MEDRKTISSKFRSLWRQKKVWQQHFTSFLLDILFPLQCLGCGQEKFWLCSSCLEKTVLKNEQFCPVCEKAITPDGRICFKCRQKQELDCLLVAVSYKNELVAKAVHYFKYRFAADLALPLGLLLTRAYTLSGLPLPEVILPVPLHQKRLRWRGFNQAELLARIISHNLSPGLTLPVYSQVLQRTKFTRPQMKIKNYSHRLQNVSQAFAINREFSGQIYHRRVLLVDDISTTGATLFECAKTLKVNGAREVYAVVIARQNYS